MISQKTAHKRATKNAHRALKTVKEVQEWINWSTLFGLSNVSFYFDKTKKDILIRVLEAKNYEIIVEESAIVSKNLLIEVCWHSL